MNAQLEQYVLEVGDLDAPPPELLQMLHRRDVIADLESTFTPAERRLLDDADRRLQRNAGMTVRALTTASSRPSTNSGGWWWRLGADAGDLHVSGTTHG